MDELQAALATGGSGAPRGRAGTTRPTRARAAFARLVGVDPRDVAVGRPVSQLLAPVAAALPDGARVLVRRQSTSPRWCSRGWCTPTAASSCEAVPVSRLAEAIATGHRRGGVQPGAVGHRRGARLRRHRAGPPGRPAPWWSWTRPRRAAGCRSTRRWPTSWSVGAYKWLMSPRGTGVRVPVPGRAGPVPPAGRRLVRGRGPARVVLRAAVAAGHDRAPVRHLAGLVELGRHRARRWSWSSSWASRRSTTTTWPWPTGSWPAWASRPATAPSSPSTCRAPTNARGRRRTGRGPGRPGTGVVPRLQHRGRRGPRPGRPHR